MKVENDFTSSPPFGLFDIFNHLIYHSSEYDKQGLAAYKSYEEYSLFREGYVESLKACYLKEAGVHAYVGQVKPAIKDKTKDGKSFYNLWFILEGKGVNRGSVVDAYCLCLGGRDGGCKHIAAALYSLEELLNSRGEDSVKSGPCLWIRKPIPETSPRELKDLKIGKGNGNSGKESTLNKSFTEYIDHDPRVLWDRASCSAEEIEDLVQTMNGMDNKPAILDILASQLERDSDAPSIPPTGREKQTILISKKTSERGIMEKKVMSFLKHEMTHDGASESSKAFLQQSVYYEGIFVFLHT